MVVAEVLTGIALVQKSVEFIKSNISTASDIRDIASSIDDLFTGEKQAQQARNRKSGGVGLSDQFGVDTVAREVIDARLAQEKLQEVATLVDLRFGHGTWSGIVAERAKRIQEAKEAAAAERRRIIKEAREFEENMKQCAIVAFVIIAAIGLFVGLFMVILK
tara:strand:- start:1404 stop:1889 length:486 start_codon:yes stop_codon:yes gene_type:complete